MHLLCKTRRDPFWILIGFTLVAVAASAAALLADWFWFADLLAHFRVYYFLFLAPASVILFWGGRWGVATLALVFAVLHLCFFLPYYGTRPGPVFSSSSSLKVASINVLTSNPHFERVIETVEQADPDIVFLMEINDAWKEKLRPLQEKWPHVLVYPQEDNFGVMFLSKVPWESAEARLFEESGVRSIEACFLWKGRPLTIFGIHPMPPVGPHGTEWRNEQLRLVTEAVKKEKGSVIVVGDFNATPWSASFLKFIRETGLREASRGFGLYNTWRNDSGFIRIPIDHICVSGDIQVRNFKVGEDIGSDHYPIFAELAFAGIWENLKLFTNSREDGNRLLGHCGLVPMPKEMKDARYQGDRVTGGSHSYYFRFRSDKDLQDYLGRCPLLRKVKAKTFVPDSASENGWYYSRDFLPELDWFNPDSLKSGTIHSAAVVIEDEQYRCDVITDGQERMWIQVGVD